MNDLSNQETDDVTVVVPDEIEGPRSVIEWYTEKGVDVAKSYYFRTKAEGVENEIKRAKRFLEEVQQGFNEAEVGSTPQVKRLRRSTMDIKDNVQRINGHLLLSSDGRPRGTPPVDLGNDSLNRMMSLINQRFDNIERLTAQRFDNIERTTAQRFDNIERTTAQRFDNIERTTAQRFDNMEKQLNSNSARIHNKFKGRGGESGSASSYKDIANKDNKFPAEVRLERLHSMDQVNSMTGPTVNKFLEFYDISTSGNVQERKNRLLQFIGVNVSTRMQETFGTGI